MSSHKITITIPTSAVGIPVDDTGIMGIVVKGVAVAGGVQLDTLYAITQVSDLVPLLVDAAYDATNSVAVFQHVSEFYAQAGPGALFWLQVTATTNTFAAYVASAAFYSYVEGTANADPGKQVKIVGLCYDVPAARQSSAAFPADVTAAVTAVMTTQKDLFSKGYCFSVIVDGYNMSSSVTPETLPTQTTNTAYAVSLCITGTKGNGISAVGLCLGRFARISIGQGLGAVADGAINTNTAYLTNGILLVAGATIIVGQVYTVQGGTVTYNGATFTTGQTFTCVTGHTTFTTADTGYVLNGSTDMTTLQQADIDALGNSQYLFITKVQGISGLFWNDGATCTATTSFFSSQEYMRVICALAYDARAFFTLLRGQGLPTDVSTGALDPTFCAAKQVSFYQTFISPLTQAAGSGDIVDGSITITGPTYGSTAQLNFSISLIRKTILGNVVGTIGFSLTL